MGLGRVAYSSRYNRRWGPPTSLYKRRIDEGGSIGMRGEGEMGSSAFSWLLRRGGGSAAGEKSGSGKGKRGEVVSREEEEEFGVTEKLQEFVRGLTVDTFKEFRLAKDDKCTLFLFTPWIFRFVFRFLRLVGDLILAINPFK